MADLIDQHQIGLNYNPGDAEGLYRCIEILLEQPELYEQIARNAATFFNEYGDAEKIYADYADHIEKIGNVKQKNTLES
jgi:hypothetical protein